MQINREYDILICVQVVRLIALVLSFAGLVVSTLLITKEFGGTLPLCEVAGMFSCEKVLSSGYSSLFGISNSSLGIFFYGLLIGLFLFNTEISRSLISLYITLSAAASAVSVYLFYISWFKIGAFCPYCVLTYFLNFLLLVNAIYGLLRAKLASGGTVKIFKPALLSAGLFIISVAITTLEAGKVNLETALVKSSETPKSPIPKDILDSLGVDEGVEIIEFVDPVCPACVKWKSERARIEKKVKTVFFPLDSSCNPAVPSKIHPASCLLSKMFICAHRFGSEKRLSEYLYTDSSVWELTQDDLIERLRNDFEAEVVCAEKEDVGMILSQHVNAGIQLNLRGTPAVYYKGLLIDFSKIPFNRFVEQVDN